MSSQKKCAIHGEKRVLLASRLARLLASMLLVVVYYFVSETVCDSFTYTTGRQ